MPQKRRECRIAMCPQATPLAKPPLARTSSTFQQVAKESYGKKSSSHILGNGEIQT